MSTTADLLIEIGTEELPPKALNKLSQALTTHLIDGIAKAQLEHQTVTSYATPRRLAVLIQQLQLAQPDQNILRRGPAVAAAFKDGKPTPAAQGFARSCGVEVDALETLETDKGQWLSFQQHQAGKTADTLLPAILQKALQQLPIPKRMRWSDLTTEFVRPVHWIVLLHGSQVIETEILGIKANRQSYGHRFHHPQAIEIQQPQDYADQLQAAYVMVDFASRQQKIKQQILAAAEAINGVAIIDDSLLDEVTALVEWPIAITGQFDEKFLQTPAEALISSMQGHQKYFPITDPNGQLLPFFITIANIESLDPDMIRTGNERVIRPRLADADFFWNQDRKNRLDSRLDHLKQVVFQKQLGTLHDKTQRVAEIANYIAEQLGANPAIAQRAAWLSQCDLLTEMVGEFPELQGIMGRYYAIHDGEDSAVATALDEQYMPRFAGDQLASSSIGQILAIATRIDTLSGIFAIGQIPTGEKDPFALRRAALGILRTLIEQKLDLNLNSLIHTALMQYPDDLFDQKLQQQIFTFINERLKAYYLEQNISIDNFDAVRVCQPQQPLDFHQRLQAVTEFRKLPNIDSLVGANKRIRNILKKVTSPLQPNVDAALLTEPQEQDLAQHLTALQEKVSTLTQQRQYTEALTELATLRAPIDAFFDTVMVMADDELIRNNRLALLNQISELFLHIADLSHLQ